MKLGSQPGSPGTTDGIELYGVAGLNPSPAWETVGAVYVGLEKGVGVAAEEGGLGGWNWAFHVAYWVPFNGSTSGDVFRIERFGSVECPLENVPEE